MFLLYVLKRAYRRQILNEAFISSLFFGLLVGDGFLLRGFMIETKLLSESQDRGKLIIQNIEKYKEENHRYPASLTEMEISGIEIPQPAIRNSEFEYKATPDGYFFSFPSTRSKYCHWRKRYINGFATNDSIS